MDDIKVAVEQLKNHKKMGYTEIKECIDEIKHKYRGICIDEVSILISSLQSDQRNNVKNSAELLLKHMSRYDAEILRVLGLYRFDSSYGNYSIIAGVDEVGRGPLAGPIVAAAVVLDKNAVNCSDIILGIKDSKKLSPHVREELAEIIKDKALCYNIHEFSNDVIDEKGISWCNNEVLMNAAVNLSIKPQLVISDGYPIKGIKIRNEFSIKGDSKSASIACASIVAKVYRDNLMKDYSLVYPEYGFESNAGYGTKEHTDAIKKFGITKIHRKSFLSGIMNQL
ncbi:MAG: ribonuclease HII [Clostridiaceae bacterium]